MFAVKSSPAVFAPFRHEAFRTLWVATMVSNLGGLIQSVGAGWTMTQLTDSHNMVALVQASSTLPIMIFSIAAGALADSFDRRTLMIIAQAGMALASLLLAVTAVMGLLTPWLLLTFTFAIGSGTALFNPAWQASLGDIVPREDLGTAVSLNSMSFNMTRSVGPALGGLIVVAFGSAVAFVINAFSYIPLIVALWRWEPRYKPRALPRERLASAILAGIRYVSLSPNLTVVLVRGFLFGFGAICVLALLPSLAQGRIAGGALLYGTLLGCFGLGAVCGALLNTTLRARFQNEAIFRMACIGFSLSCLGLGFSTNPILSHLLLLPAGACWVLALSLLNVSVQLSSPRWVVGRTLSLYQTATFGGMAGGSWAWGYAADVWSLDWSFTLAAGVLLLCAGVGLLLPLAHFDTADLNPANNFNEPALRLGLKPRSGPILIMVEYRIGDEDTDEFLTLMAQRRRIRIRDGARGWALLRDLEDPQVWIEEYRVPTWTEYVRHNLRRTRTDAENTELVRKLHRGSAPPRIRRTIERPTVPMHEDLVPLPDTDV